MTSDHKKTKGEFMSMFHGIKRVGLVLLVLFCVSGFLFAAGQGEGTVESIEKYPSRNIDIYVGHGAGGGTDMAVRAVTRELEEILGIKFNIINQIGAAGVVAKTSAANAPADGYTLVALTNFPVTTASGDNPNGLDVLIPVARLQSDTYCIQVLNGKYKSIDELVAYAKANPNRVRISGVAAGGMDDLHVQMFGNAAGIQLNYVPMNGAGDMHAALRGGHIDAILEEVGPTISYIQEGSFKPLIFFSQERIEGFNDVPTTYEKGWNIDTGIERALGIRADVDKEKIKILENAIEKALNTDRYKKYEKDSYLHFRKGFMDSDDYTERLRHTIPLYASYLK